MILVQWAINWPWVGLETPPFESLLDRFVAHKKSEDQCLLHLEVAQGLSSAYRIELYAFASLQPPAQTKSAF